MIRHILVGASCLASDADLLTTALERRGTCSRPLTGCPVLLAH
jgi:hypothetical protein